MADEIGKPGIDYYDLCKRENITDEIVVFYAAQGCEEYGEEYCLPDIEEKCEVT